MPQGYFDQILFVFSEIDQQIYKKHSILITDRAVVQIRCRLFLADELRKRFDLCF